MRGGYRPVLPKGLDLLYVLLAPRGVPMEVAALGAMGLIVGLRLGAIFWRLELPVVRLPEDGQG